MAYKVKCLVLMYFVALKSQWTMSNSLSQMSQRTSGSVTFQMCTMWTTMFSFPILITITPITCTFWTEMDKYSTRRKVSVHHWFLRSKALKVISSFWLPHLLSSSKNCVTFCKFNDSTYTPEKRHKHNFLFKERRNAKPLLHMRVSLSDWLFR